MLKWVVGATAVLSLFFAVQQLIQTLSDTRERRRQIEELYATGKAQQGNADYPAAWASFEAGLEKAESGAQLAKLTGRLDKERRKLRQAEEDVAMKWLENIVVPEGQSFSDVVDQLLPALNRGVTGASGQRKADLLAHIGWGYFLKSRDGVVSADPEAPYEQALEADPANPYAHANWAHYLVWQREDLDGARTHFAAAVASGRARDYVRRMQLAAFKRLEPDGGAEFLAVVNDMRKNGEPIDAATRGDAYSIYYFACTGSDPARFDTLLAAVPAAEQLATFQAMFGGDASDDSRSATYGLCRAMLSEAAGQREEALRIFKTIRPHYPPGDGGVGDRVAAAIRRLSPP